MEDATNGGKALPHINEGDVAKAEAEHGPVHEFVYRMPILTHSAMEPMNCTLHVRKDSCDVWVGTQVAGRARQAVADVTGLPLDKVMVHNQLLGGGFGRRLDVDGVILAAKIAKQVDGPVKGHLEPRGGHPPRLLSLSELQQGQRDARSGRHARLLASSRDRARRHGALAAGFYQEWHRP